MLDAIKEKYPVDLIPVPEGEKPDLSQYRMVGFASGIYWNKLHQSVLDYAIDNREELEGKDTFSADWRPQSISLRICLKLIM